MMLIYDFNNNQNDNKHLPIPPCRAKAIAISDSVTVSIGELTNGVFNVIFLVKADERSTDSAVKSIYPGNIIKSSYVSPISVALNIEAALNPSSGTYPVWPLIKKFTLDGVLADIFAELH